VKVATAAVVSVGFVAVTVPVLPTGGVVVVHPGGAVNDTNVVLAGIRSLRLRPWASLGPTFVTRITYVTFAPARTGSGVSDFVIDKSAVVTTAVVSVSLLLPGVASVGLATVAVLEIVEAAGALELTSTTNVNVAVAPGASVAAVAVNVPVPPTAGFDSVKAGPAVCAADTNVVFAGTASLSDTLLALLGPLLLTVIV